MMDSVLAIEAQKGIELKYSRQQIKRRIQADIDASDEVLAKMAKGVELIETWMEGPFSYPEKVERLKHLKKVDLPELVNDLMLVILPLSKSALFTAVVGQVSGYLQYSDRADGVKTIAEILAVLCETDLFDLFPGKNGSWRIQSNYALTKETQKYIAETKFLPPMLCPPNILRHNHDSAYLLTKSSLILGGAVNYHNGNIRLGHLNRMNQIPFKLDLDMLNLYEETPSKVLDTREQREAFNRMKEESLRVYAELAAYGNKFYLTHHPDKRGRTYAHGYHVSTQGSEYKKAIIELAEEEHVEGLTY